VASGGYDSEQLIASLRVLHVNGRPELGIDGRGVVALESFVLARYMMFASVYFHHTTRAFERVLVNVLRRLWGDPRALDDIQTYLAWDDFRVLDVIRTDSDQMAQALRDRVTIYGLAAEFNAEHDLATYAACERALRSAFGDAVWSDSQEQLLHRLPLGGDGRPTVHVRVVGRIVDARSASDLIAKLSGKAYWRKLFVRKSEADIDLARALCRDIIVAQEVPSLFDAASS
jgi:HD superfamily phosphohydrolase